MDDGCVSAQGLRGPCPRSGGKRSCFPGAEENHRVVAARRLRDGEIEQTIADAAQYARKR